MNSQSNYSFTVPNSKINKCLLSLSSFGKQTLMDAPMIKLLIILKRPQGKKVNTFIMVLFSLKILFTIDFYSVSQTFLILADIITVSHYCCKLKKMHFVDLELRSNRVTVLPKSVGVIQVAREIVFPQASGFDYSQSLLLRELSLVDNILLNMSSLQTLKNGGINIDDIKTRVMKQAENKMLRRLVDTLPSRQKRHAERNGRVFEFKYTNTLAPVAALLRQQEQEPPVPPSIESKPNESEDEQILERESVSLYQKSVSLFLEIEEWIYTRFGLPLLNVVNERLTEYISSVGRKNSRRQCTSLKYTRYVGLLNLLHTKGPRTVIQLKKHLVNCQRNLGIGQMHKRSLISLLFGLEELGIVTTIKGCVYPKWKDCALIESQSEQIKQDQQRRHKLTSEQSQKRIRTNNHEFQVVTISQRAHQTELFSSLVTLILQKAVQRRLKNTFQTLLRNIKEKAAPKLYEPCPSLVHLIECSNELIPRVQSQTHGKLLVEVEQLTREIGRVASFGACVDDEVIRFLRRHPFKEALQLRKKYGAEWTDKFASLAPYITISPNQGVKTLPNSLSSIEVNYFL